MSKRGKCLKKKMTMTGAIEGRPIAKVSKVSKERKQRKQVLLTWLYSLQTQNRSPFPAEAMKTTNN